ncbi:MUCEN protein, partial [Smithornis capensis]|nr:MUCEN protein [Smithornis capensis]
FADIILPVVITLIVITLSVFSLVALYRMCQKKTPGIFFYFLLLRESNSDKEGVKLLSVKTTSPETGEDFLSVYVCL